MNYYPPFLQRIINSSNLCNANQHLPHLGVQKGGQSTPLLFHWTALHHSNLYKVDETFRQGQKEKQTKPNPTLGFLSLSSGSSHCRQPHLQTKGPRVPQLTDGKPCYLNLPSLLCCVLGCACLIQSDSTQEAQPLKAGVIGIADDTFDHRRKWAMIHTSKHANSCTSPKSRNFQRLYIFI